MKNKCTDVWCCLPIHPPLLYQLTHTTRCPNHDSPKNRFKNRDDNKRHAEEQFTTRLLLPLGNLLQLPIQAHKVQLATISSNSCHAPPGGAQTNDANHFEFGPLALTTCTAYLSIGQPRQRICWPRHPKCNQRLKKLSRLSSSGLFQRPQEDTFILKRKQRTT